VQGTVAEGFEEVREEFTAVLAEEPAEPGAQLAAYVNNRQMVDLWAGSAVTGDSLTGVFSSGKGAAYLVVALLVQDGVLALDQTVAHYWPEFAAEGKADVTLRELLTHRAGVIGVDGGFTTEELADDRLIAKRLADQRPYWKPGSAYGYHCFVIGALIGEVVRRAPLLKPKTLAEFSKLHSTGIDLVSGKRDLFALGFEAKGLQYPFLGANAFGHCGVAGSEAFADPHSGVAYGYTRRHFAFGFAAPENDRLAAAVLRAAEALG